MNKERILVLRPDNIGDVVLFSGALQHIRNLYPHSYITLAVQAHVVNLIELCPYVDECVAIGLLTWWGRLEPYVPNLVSAVIRFIVCSLNKIWNLIINPFDAIIYPLKSPQVAHLSLIKFLSVKKVYGICGCSINCPDNGYPSGLTPESLYSDFLDVTKEDPWRHEFLTTLDFLQFMGSNIETPDDLFPQFWLSGHETKYLDLEKHTDKKIIALFPSASFNEKKWSVENYASFVKQLSNRHLYVILGAHLDREFNSQIERSIKESLTGTTVVNLTGMTTLRELVVAIKSSDLFLGIDTSGLHIAIALDVSTIGIIGGGHYGRFVPWGKTGKQFFFSKKMECFHCNWKCTKNYIECINDMALDEITTCAINMLK